MLITHKKLHPVQCYHIFSNSMVVYLAKNHYGSYSTQMVPTNPPGSWPIIMSCMLYLCSHVFALLDLCKKRGSGGWYNNYQTPNFTSELCTRGIDTCTLITMVGQILTSVLVLWNGMSGHRLTEGGTECLGGISRTGSMCGPCRQMALGPSVEGHVPATANHIPSHGQMAKRKQLPRALIRHCDDALSLQLHHPTVVAKYTIT